jgi:NADH dehydrogenase (ubiquinone) 1 alpha subcomplex subunit 9
VGIEDHFFNYMIYQLSFGVVAPVVDTGSARLAPTWVHDVADAVTAVLRQEASKGTTYHLAGPETLTCV